MMVYSTNIKMCEKLMHKCNNYHERDFNLLPPSLGWSEDEGRRCLVNTGSYQPDDSWSHPRTL
jgi:hypothetical protein